MIEEGVSETARANPEVELERLRSRVDRERKARRQAEMIAERGMRELWEANRDLQDRVAKRSAELERVTNAIEYAQIARLCAINELADDLAHELRTEGSGGGDVDSILEQMRSLSEPSRSVDDALQSDNGAVELADRLVERWQRSAAKRGQLLTIEEGDSTVEHVARWSQMLAIADTLIGAIVRVGGGGSTAVRITARADDATLRVGGAALAGALAGAQPGEHTAPSTSGLRAYMALAARIAATVGGQLDIADVNGGLGVVVRLPQPH